MHRMSLLKRLSALFLLVPILLLPLVCGGIFEVAQGETFLGWQVDDGAGSYSEADGVIVLTNDSPLRALSLYREFKPQTGFEISLQVKAETLGEVNVDPLGAGEGFAWGFGTDREWPSYHIAVEIRGRSGGQFVYNYLYPNGRNNWNDDWTPFIYNGLGFNNGYDFWHNNPLVDKSNAPVQPDVWYTIKFRVTANPFNITSEVYAENGTLLGSMVSHINTFDVTDIKYVSISCNHGGTFYVKDFIGITPTSAFNYSPSQPTVDMPVSFNASGSGPRDQVTDYLWNFGDGNTTTTSEPLISHIYSSSGQFNVSLTVADIFGLNSSTVQAVNVWMPTQLTISTEPHSVIGSPINIMGRLSDDFGIGLSNEPVILQYTFPGADQWYPISSAFTDDAGNYAVQWINTATGSFTLKATWKGNATHLNASSTVTLNSLPYQEKNVFVVESNSTVTALAFNSTTSELSFRVSGPSGTEGYVRVTIAKNLVSNAADMKVTLDGKQLSYNLTETEDTWVLLFNYSHSTHFVSVYLPTSAISISTPEPSASLLPSASIVPTDSPQPSVKSEPVEVNYWLLAGIVVAAAVAIGLAFRKGTKQHCPTDQSEPKI
jgi:hypothetical protein